MKVILDADILIDVLERREPHFENSYRIVQLAYSNAFEGYMPAGNVSDIYHIVNRNVKDRDRAIQAIIELISLVNVCSTEAIDIVNALNLNMPDFEDAILASTARRERVDCIVTRNVRDFVNSPVPAMEPKAFLEQFESYYKGSNH